MRGQCRRQAARPTRTSPAGYWLTCRFRRTNKFPPSVQRKRCPRRVLAGSGGKSPNSISGLGSGNARTSESISCNAWMASSRQRARHSLFGRRYRQPGASRKAKGAKTSCSRGGFGGPLRGVGVSLLASPAGVSVPLGPSSRGFGPVGPFMLFSLFWRGKFVGSRELMRRGREVLEAVWCPGG